MMAMDVDIRKPERIAGIGGEAHQQSGGGTQRPTRELTLEGSGRMQPELAGLHQVDESGNCQAGGRLEELSFTLSLPS